MNMPAEQSARPKSFMGMERTHTLATRLVGLGTAMVIVSLLVLGVGWFTVTRQVLQTEVQRRQEEVTLRVATQIAKLLGESPQVNYTQIWSILKTVDVGPEGVIYLVDDTGHLLGYAGIDALQGQDVSGLPIVTSFRQRRPVAGEVTGFKGEPVMGAWAALDNGWGVIVETPTRQALAQLDQLALIFWGTLLGSVLLATVAMDLFARRLTQPLRRLQEGAEAIGQGDLNYTIDIRTGDEIEDLSKQFNQMARDLKTSRTEIETHASELEQRVADRTRDLERRATLLATAADVGRIAASILEPESLTSQVVDLVRERFDLYYAGLFLLDKTGEDAILEAGTGEAGRIMLAQGHRLAVGGKSLVGAACAQRRARVALDVGGEPVRFDNPLLPETRSEMALPLVVGDHVLGALDVQSTRSAAFSEEDIAVLQLVADQVAMAIENARKFSVETALLEAGSPIFRAGRRLTLATTTEEVTDAIIASVTEAGADGCVVVEFEFSPAGEPETLHYLGVWRRDREPQFQRGLRLPIAQSPFPLEMVSTLWTVADVRQDQWLPESARQVFLSTGVGALANIPLEAGGKVIGQVVVLRVEPGRFSEGALRLYEVLSDQAAVALERARLLEEARRSAARQRLVSEVVDKMRRAADMDSLLQTTVREMAAILGTSSAFVQLTVPGALTADEDSPALRLAAT